LTVSITYTVNQQQCNISTCRPCDISTRLACDICTVRQPWASTYLHIAQNYSYSFRIANSDSLENLWKTRSADSPRCRQRQRRL